MNEVDESKLEVMQPLFDPIAFQRDHPDPRIDEYRLSNEEWLERGIEVTLIRRRIIEKAKAHKDPPLMIPIELVNKLIAQHQP